MIKTETITVNGRQLLRTYSDAGLMIARDGALYTEAVDPADSGRTYTETDQPIPETVYASDTDAKAAAYDILMGVTE